jgi:hypothetical protein
MDNWQELASVPATQSGVFAYTWQPSTAGNYSIKASWPGDSAHSPVFQMVSVKVVDPSMMPTGGVGTLVRDFETVRATPYVGGVITFAASMLRLGFILTSFFVPSGSPMLGYLFGSLILGFIFIFPLSALVILVGASKTRRKPSLLWLAPLLTVWLVSLVLIFFSPAILSPPLTVAAQLLLISSNVFAIPLLVTFGLAKLVV